MNCPKPKRIPLPKLRAALTDVCHPYIRKRDARLFGGMCVICGQRPIQCAYHILRKTRGDGIRWFEFAIVGACFGCNYGELRHPHLYLEKHIDIFGIEWINAIRAISRNGTKFDRVDTQALTGYYIAKTESLLLDYKPGEGLAALARDFRASHSQYFGGLS